MFWRKPGLLIMIVLVLFSLGGASQAQGVRQIQTSSLPVKGTFFVATDINRALYVINIAAEAQDRIQIGSADSAAVADFDQDGFCEILAIKSTLVATETTSTSANLTLYKQIFNNQYEVEFSPQVVFDDAYPLSGFYFGPKLGDTAVADFDRDGRLDVAFSGRGCTENPCTTDHNMLVQVLLNKASGFVRQPVEINALTSLAFEHMAGLDEGDFNGDGFVDLAAQQYWDGNDNLTHLLLGNGTGALVDTSWTPNTFAAASGGTSSLVSGDFDGDQILDLVIGQDDDGDPGQAWFLKGNGNGSFTYVGEAYDTNPVETGEDMGGAGYADAFDFDGDGNLDIITAAEKIALLLFLGNGDGTFGPNPIVMNTNESEMSDWFKVAAPPLSAAPCSWISANTVYLPIIP